MGQEPNETPSSARERSAGPGRPLPTRERQRRATRDLIFEAAVREISEAGLVRARIEQIARRAGVTRPTFYAHFPTKEDVLLELQARTEQSTLDALRARLGAEDGGNPVHQLVDAVFDLLESADAVLRREAFGLMVREPNDAQWPDNELFEFVRTRLDDARARGDLGDGVDAAELTRIVMTALFGFLAIDAEPVEDRRQRAHQLIELLVRGASSR